MSRVGKYPIVLKSGVSANVTDGKIEVVGSKGKLSLDIPACISVVYENNSIIVSTLDSTKNARSLWGTIRALINNMVIGVSEGFKRNLEINGVGYKSSMKSDKLLLNLGFSHEVLYEIPSSVQVVCSDPTHISVSSINKQEVGFVAAQIRSFKKPEPFKGKGIKYDNEVILRKEGKKK